MGSAAPADTLAADHSQVRFVDQGGGLPGVFPTLVGHLLLGNGPQLFLDERKQRLGGLLVAGLRIVQQACDVARTILVKFW